METSFKLFATPATWLEQPALDQLKQTAALPDVNYAVAFPDLHPGKGSPIGVAMATNHLIYPHVIGNDIGCGMALFSTAIEQRRFNLDRALKLLDRFPNFADIPLADSHEAGQGTIGGGNHFAELVAIDTIDAPADFAQSGIDAKTLSIIVHSGSRGLGDAILRQVISDYRAQEGLEADSPGGIWYRDKHDRALVWAKQNRQLIASRVLSGLGLADSSLAVVDLVHNGLEQRQVYGRPAWLHRKGAAAADHGIVIIPGSRGTHSYLVAPLAPDDASLYSLAHGAGRKWQRSMTKGKLGDKYTIDTIRHNKLGGQVFCRDRSLLFEEAPEAYKNIDRVISDLVAFGLIRVVARFRPVLTIKY